MGISGKLVDALGLAHLQAYACCSVGATGSNKVASLSKKKEENWAARTATLRDETRSSSEWRRGRASEGARRHPMAPMRRDERFKNLKNIVQLSILLVETNKNVTYNLVYKLFKLMFYPSQQLRGYFSPVTFMNNKLQNKMGN